MADTIPAAWRTVFRPDGGHFGGRSGTLSAMISERCPRSPARGRQRPAAGGASRRKPFSRPPFALFAEERDGGPTEACDAQNQRHTPLTSVGRPVELPANRPSDRLRQDGGRRVPAASERGGADELGHRRGPRRGRTRGAAIPG